MSNPATTPGDEQRGQMKRVPDGKQRDAVDLIGSGADIAGAAVGGALGLIGGPVGVAAGAVGGVVVARSLKAIGDEIAVRVLGTTAADPDGRGPGDSG